MSDWRNSCPCLKTSVLNLKPCAVCCWNRFVWSFVKLEPSFSKQPVVVGSEGKQTKLWSVMFQKVNIVIRGRQKVVKKVVAAVWGTDLIQCYICRNTVLAPGWFEEMDEGEQTLSGMDALEKWMIFRFTPNQTVTHSKWIFFQKLSSNNPCC